MKKVITICLLSILIFSVLTGCEKQENVIKLDGNTGTGYEWFATEYDSKNIKLEAGDFIAENTQLAGSGGVFPITVTPKSKKSYGKDYTIHFCYYRPFEEIDKSACYADVDVSVDKDGKVTVGEVKYTNPNNDSTCY